MPVGSFSLTISQSDAGRAQAGEAGEVDGGLGVPGAAQHAAVLGAQRDDVARAGRGRPTWCPASARSRMVCARSEAEMPVVTPSRASTVTVYAVPRRSWLTRNIGGRSSRSASASVTGTQM